MPTMFPKPGTSPGFNEVTPVLLPPSWPPELSPQHSACPAASSEQVCAPLPAVTATVFVSPVTATGFGEETLAESPSWPCAPAPQQADAPPPLRPQGN